MRLRALFENLDDTDEFDPKDIEEPIMEIFADAGAWVEDWQEHWIQLSDESNKDTATAAIKAMRDGNYGLDIANVMRITTVYWQDLQLP